MGRYISDKALRNLDKYAYKGVDKSVLSKYILNPYWNQLVKLWPKSVAPNTITLTGLSLVFINFATMLYYDPQYLTPKHGAVGPPHWVYYSWAAGLFMYQSLDAIDGKQARRTGMAGPLGEMFDHGCDALNTTLECLLAAYALNLGRSWWTVASQVATLANFYLTTWEEYHTGQLFLGVFSGPVEGILMIVGIYVISGTYGPQVWDTNLFSILRLDRIDGLHKLLPVLPLNEAFMVIGAFGLAFNIFTSYSNVYRSAKRMHTSALLLPILRLLPFPLACLLHISWLAHPLASPAQSALVNSALFVPFCASWGLTFAHQVGRMILAHVTKRPGMPWWDWTWVVLALGAVDLHAPTLLGPTYYPYPSFLLATHALEPSAPTASGPASSQQLPTGPTARLSIAVYAVFLLSLVTYARFCYVVIDDITNYMGIACFTVRKKGRDGVWRSAELPPSPGSKGGEEGKKLK